MKNLITCLANDCKREGFSMKLKDSFFYLVGILFIWCVVSSVKPHWEKYLIGIEIERAAIYGTKHTVDETRKLLNKKMKEDGHPFTDKDFIIEKDEYNDVYMSLTYDDEIKIFGFWVKPIEFTIEKFSSETK